jgi:hypothetical protein
MAARILSVFIVVFWLTMTGLLLRKELGPGDSALRVIPIEHVVKLLLLHETPSDLNIYNDKLRLGHLRVHPQVRKEDDARIVAFSGNLQVLIPGMERQRVQWAGELEMQKDLTIRRFIVNLVFRDPALRDAPGYAAQVTVVPSENRLRYTVSEGGREIDGKEFPLDQRGIETALQSMLDPSMLKMIAAQTRTASPPVVKALLSSMPIHGERIDTYLVTVEAGGQTLVEFDVSQLGTILRAKTLIGYTFAPDDIVP